MQNLTTNATEILLSARNMQCHYGAVHALRGVDLDLQAGELFALIGPNGAGKSTLFAALAGEVPHASGTVKLAGHAIETLSVAQRSAAGLGRSYQTAQVFATLSVLDNVNLAMHFSGKMTENTALDYLQHAGLADYAMDCAGSLSYPNRKRLDVVLAMAQSPKVLLMDEPTAGLDADSRHALLSWVKAAAKARGMGVIFTEHNMDAVFAFADRIAVLVRGRIIALGSPAEIATNEDVRAAYLGENFQIKANLQHAAN